MEKNKVLFIDMYGVIIKESKGYFVPYTFQRFETSEYGRLTKAFKEEKCFSKAQKGELTNEEFLSYLGYQNPRETMEDYLKNYLTLDEQFHEFAQANSGQIDFCLLSNDVLEILFNRDGEDYDGIIVNDFVELDIKLKLIMGMPAN